MRLVMAGLVTFALGCDGPKGTTPQVRSAPAASSASASTSANSSPSALPASPACPAKVTEGPERDATWSARFPVEGGGMGLVTTPEATVGELAIRLGMASPEKVDCDGVRSWWLAGFICEGQPTFLERLTPTEAVRAAFCVKPLEFDELLSACAEKRIDLAACKRGLGRLDQECAAHATSSCEKRRQKLSSVLETTK